MDSGIENETFTQEAERLAQQRLAELTAGDEDADLKLALATLKKIAERPARAPRGRHDSWGWSVGDEHAIQEGTEPITVVIDRIRRSYEGFKTNRDPKEIGALETIVAALRNYQERPGLASHDLKRIVKLLDTIISDRIGPGDDPSGKPSKYVLLPGTKTAAQIALEMAKPVTEPTTGAKHEYIHARSSHIPDFTELEGKYGKSEVYVELQRIKLGMNPLNIEIATALAEIAEYVEIAKQREAPAALEAHHPSPTQAGQTHLPEDRSRNLTGAAVQPAGTVMTDQAQIGIAQLGTPVSGLPTLTADRKPQRPKFGDFSKQVDFTDPADGLTVRCLPDTAIIKSKYFQFNYTYRQLYYDNSTSKRRDKGIIDIAETENSNYYPFTLDYIKFIRQADKLIDEQRALMEVRKKADKEGPLSRMRLRWKDHAEGVPYRMADWQQYAWQRHMTQQIERMWGKPDWEALKQLNDWRDWGEKPPEYEYHAPA